MPASKARHRNYKSDVFSAYRYISELSYFISFVLKSSSSKNHKSDLKQTMSSIHKGSISSTSTLPPISISTSNPKLVCCNSCTSGSAYPPSNPYRLAFLVARYLAVLFSLLLIGLAAASIQDINRPNWASSRPRSQASLRAALTSSASCGCTAARITCGACSTTVPWP
jgi:hypothetical protein